MRSSRTTSPRCSARSPRSTPGPRRAARGRPPSAGAAPCRHRHGAPRPDAGARSRPGRRAGAPGRHRSALRDDASRVLRGAGRSAERSASARASPPPARAARRRRAASPIPPASFSGPVSPPTSRRPGAALYGINPTPGHANPMRAGGPAAGARAAGARSAPAGSRRLQRHLDAPRGRSRIATAGIGYADGWHPQPVRTAARRSLTGARPAGRACLHGPHHLRRDRPSRHRRRRPGSN